MKTKYLLLVLLVVLPILLWGQKPSCTNLVGTWHNELSSTLEIQNVDRTSGTLTGKLVTKDGYTATVVGYINDGTSSTGNHVPVIGFVARWNVGSITTWCGYYQTDKKGTCKITGQWILSRPNSQFDYDHLLTGVDFFTPGPVPKN